MACGGRRRERPTGNGDEKRGGEGVREARKVTNKPSIKSSGNSGESAIKSPPKPQPISATVTGLTNGLILLADVLSVSASPSAGASGVFLSLPSLSSVVVAAVSGTT